MTSLLETQGLRVAYNNIVAVKDVSLSIDAGETVGIIGLNGAGKTSLIRAITGLVKPANGAIRYRGADITKYSRQQIVREGIVLVHEGRRILTSLTVQENLMLCATAMSPGRESAEKIENVLDTFPGLRRLLNRDAGVLSGGEQQQLAIARALLLDPKFLILDEPSMGLAPKIVDDVFEVVNDLRNQGLSILVVEQNVNRTLEVADRIYLMSRGEITQTGRAEEFRDADALHLGYFGKAEK